MTIWRFGQLVAVLTVLGAGCGSSDRPGANAPAAGTTASNASPQKAQPKLKTLKIWLGPEEMVAEIAIKKIEIQTGMMHRTAMAENEGMLFVFPAPSQPGFWMRNTVLPLSCAYIDPDGVILETHHMTPLDETPIKATSNRVQYVLETKQGWFERHNVKPGMLIRTERGSLSETFFRKQ